MLTEADADRLREKVVVICEPYLDVLGPDVLNELLDAVDAVLYDDREVPTAERLAPTVERSILKKLQK